jgi:large subunit ribosomal protein L20
MTRVKRGFKARRRRKSILKLASGYYSTRSNLFKTAKESVEKARCYSYRDRKNKKRNFRKLWILRINSAARKYKLNYSILINKLKKKNILLNRFILSEMALNNLSDFKKIINMINN